MAEDPWLVVGLGNPEDEHGGSRHNVGADVVRGLADRHRVSLSRNRRVRCEVARTSLSGGPRLVLAVPTGYMNRSGGPVQQAARWFKVPPERLVVVHDDLDLPLGAIRLKRGGGPGGHNGLRDLDRALPSREYLRVRLGIGRPPGRMAPRDYVLGRFPPADREVIDVAVVEAGDAVEQLVREGLEATQNRFHGQTAREG